MKHSKQVWMLIFSIFLVVVAVFIEAIWIYVSESNPEKTHMENVTTFLSYFPGFLQNPLRISLVIVFFSLTAIVLSFITMNTATQRFKLAYAFIVPVAAIMILLQVWSFM